MSKASAYAAACMTDLLLATSLLLLAACTHGGPVGWEHGVPMCGLSG